MTVRIRTTCRDTLCRLCGGRIAAGSRVAVVGHYKPSHPACAIQELTRRRARLNDAITRIRAVAGPDLHRGDTGRVVGFLSGEPVVLTGSGARA